jgi:SNF2-related domain
LLYPTLQMKLMLHQEHAVAWMMQMEHLPGKFGINSLLWEEREFLDGGRYYVCESLGQVRLQPPAVMKGGLLCDEMGLGACEVLFCSRDTLVP